MKALIIADFNLTRFDDVKLMSDYAKKRYGLVTVLIRSKPGSREQALTDYVLDIDPLDPTFAEQAYHRIRKLRLSPIAVLPFSDNSVSSGAALAEKFGLPGDSVWLAQAAFSKQVYRKMERAVLDLMQGQGVSSPAGARIESLDDLRAFARRCPRGFVLKPSCEGNNRGVIRLNERSDLSQAWDEVRMYQAGGIVCEEWIDLPGEASFDGVGHLHFVTEKISRLDRYPVEKGQVVPARFSVPLAAAVSRAGRVASLISGQRIGPFHNEIKYDLDSFATAVVEPNRRPAGMKIWHLAEKVFGVNFFHLWIDQLITGSLPARLPEPKGSAGIRMLAAPESGYLRYQSRSEIEQSLFESVKLELSAKCEWFDFSLNRDSGSFVSTVQKDNSDFIAQVCAYSSEDGFDINQALDRFEDLWFKKIAQYIAPESREVAV